MSFLYEKPTSSAESLLSTESDPESKIPEPEPLGSSKALSPAPFHKWWWRKKPAPSAPSVSKSPPRAGSGKSLASVKEKFFSSSSGGSNTSNFMDAKVGFVLILLLVLAITTLVTVQFRDSELILAIFTALALFILGGVYYLQCCSGTSWFSMRKAKSASTDFTPIALPSANPAVGTNGLDDSASGVVVGDKPSMILPQTCSLVAKPSPHRRDWSLPALPTSGWLNHRRPNAAAQSTLAANSTSVPTGYAVPVQQQQKANELVTKLRLEFDVDDPVRSRVDHLSAALNLVAAASKDSIWVQEAKLADAITCALTSCMSGKLLTEIKQAMDQELRQSALNERYETLYAAVFHFLQKGERDAVLTHLSAVHKLDSEQQVIEGQQQPKLRLLISDIDDTLVPTFKDRRGFSWGVPYPGVRQLYKELAGAVDGNLDQTALSQRVSFVTARPGILRTWTKQEITKAGFGGSLILMGYATTATSPQGMLAQKVKQVRELRSLWPECSVVLVGDNGQRDIDLGAMLLKEALVEAVFIHDIFASQEEMTRTTSTSFGGELDSIPLLEHNNSSSFLEDEDDVEARLKMKDDDRLAAIQAKPIGRLVSAPAALGTSTVIPSITNHVEVSKKRLVVLEPSVPIGFRHEECSEAGIDLFQTYAGAALKCFQKGLIDIAALERVARACASDLGSISIDGLVKQRLVDGLLRDVARVALEFRDKSSSEKVEFLEFVHEAIKRGTQYNNL